LTGGADHAGTALRLTLYPTASRISRSGLGIANSGQVTCSHRASLPEYSIGDGSDSAAFSASSEV